MEEAIERVDQLVRRNNAKYKDQQSQKAYEDALRDYERQAQAEKARLFAETVKQGNRRAVEKAKEARRTQKKHKKRPPPTIPEEPAQKPAEPPKKRMSEAEVKVVNQTIEARAERIIQEQQLERLNRKLDEERKRTKLYELNEKCKKMLSKSHERILPARNVPEDRMKILRKLEDKAVGEIHELDDIINTLIDKANANNNHALPHTHSSKPMPKEQQEEEGDVECEMELPDFDGLAEFDDLENDFLRMNTLIFEKSSEELLKMDYIPL